MKRIAALLLSLIMLFAIVGCTAQESNQSEDPVPPAQTPEGAPKAGNPEQGEYTYADTIKWDGEYDVVVVGFGGAGAVAAKTAADAGAGVLIVEKAPEGEEGGNTRYCGQLFAYGNNDYEATLAYYKQLAGGHDVPEEMLEVYADSIARMADILADEFGANKAEFMDWSSVPLIGTMSPEYPEFEGSEKIGLWTLHQGISDSYLWQLLRKNVTDRAESIDVWFESPGTALIQDPESGTILGVTVERGGKTLNVRAKNGVVLTTGGFENNPHMVETYLGLKRYAPIGGLYNTGDGIRMALDAGADLWHMEVYEGIGDFGGSTFAVEPGVRGMTLFGSALTKGAAILVAGDGTRYLREDEVSRHGHIDQGGVWINPNHPGKSYLIIGQAVLDAAVEKKTIAQDDPRILSAASVSELAALIGVNEQNLTNTINDFNSYAKNGKDPEFGRSAESMAAFDGAAYYAIEMIPNILNTQGGPRRNVNAQILDRDGNPIPHLYSAGEMGGITAYQYQGGGNVAECITFGMIAGKNAAAPKTDALPVYKARTPVESGVQYTQGVESDIAPAAEGEIALGNNEYLGTAEGMGGAITVKVTMEGGKIAKVEVLSHKESAGIADPALAGVPEAIVAANSAEVDTVSGATITSRGIIAAVKDALSKVN